MNTLKSIVVKKLKLSRMAIFCLLFSFCIISVTGYVISATAGESKTDVALVIAKVPAAVSAEATVKSASAELSEGEVMALYEKGYSFSDIAMSQHYSRMTGKTVVELLTLKGTCSPENNKTWEDVCLESGLELRTTPEQLGMTEEEIKALEAAEYDLRRITQTALLMKGYGKPLSKIMEMYATMTVDEMEMAFCREKLVSLGVKDTDIKISELNTFKARLDTETKVKLGITAELENKCSAAGITDISEMAVVKNMTDRFSVTADIILEMRASGKTYIQIGKELEAK